MAYASSMPFFSSVVTPGGPYQWSAFYGGPPPSPFTPSRFFAPPDWRNAFELSRHGSGKSTNENEKRKSFFIEDILGCSHSSSVNAHAHDERNHTSSKSATSPLKSLPPSMFSFYILPTQKERNRQWTRMRTVFNGSQLKTLEQRFEQKKYLSTPERIELARDLGLNPVTVKTWFQNKRMKWKKDLQKVDPSCRPIKGRGRPPRYSVVESDPEDLVIVD